VVTSRKQQIQQWKVTIIRTLCALVQTRRCRYINHLLTYLLTNLLIYSSSLTNKDSLVGLIRECVLLKMVNSFTGWLLWNFRRCGLLDVCFI